MHKNHDLLALLLSLGFVSLACPTRPIDRSDGSLGGRAGSDDQDGSAGSGLAGKGAAGGDTGGTMENGGGAGGRAAAGAGGAGLGGPGGAGGARSGETGGAALGGAAGTGTAGTGGSSAGGPVGGSNTAGTGGCASACGPTQTCVGTTCLLNDGQQCTLANQCATGTCTPFYQDVDGDGYGTGAAVGFCGTSIPVGYSAQTGDCCDNASNLALAKLIHPNADFQTASAGGVCGVTWDYNCDGTIETSLSNGGCDPGATYPTCARIFINYPQSDCGTVQNDYACGGDTVPSTSGPGTMNICVGGTNSPGTLGCK
jgi:hypothetical protein